MNLIDVVRYYRRHAYLDKDAYGCLLFALQLPSICSRIKKRAGFAEYVNLDADKKNISNGCVNIEIHLVCFSMSFCIMIECGRNFVKVFIS